MSVLGVTTWLVKIEGCNVSLEKKHNSITQMIKTLPSQCDTQKSQFSHSNLKSQFFIRLSIKTLNFKFSSIPICSIVAIIIEKVWIYILHRPIACYISKLKIHWNTVLVRFASTEHPSQHMKTLWLLMTSMNQCPELLWNCRPTCCPHLLL